MGLVSEIVDVFAEEKAAKIAAAEAAAAIEREENARLTEFFRASSYLTELSSSQNETKKASLFHCSSSVWIKAFYKHVALRSANDTETKIILSPDVLNALTTPQPYNYMPGDSAGMTIRWMAEKNFKLSLLFRSSAEMESPDGQEFMKIVSESAKQNPAFAENLHVGVLDEDDLFQHNNCEGFSTLENYRLHVYRYEYTNSEGRGAVASLNRPDTAANLSKGFDTLFARARPVALKLAL